MNAAILVDGYAEGGAEAAKARLELFWQSVSRAALLSPFRRTPLDVMLGRGRSIHRPSSLLSISPRGFSRRTISIRAVRIHCAKSWPNASTSSALQTLRSNSL
jgi:hypothetical protein